MDNIEKWLKSLRLHKYTHLFKELTYEQMLNLDENYLIERDVTKGARNKMLVSVKKLNLRQERLVNMIDDLDQNNISMKEALTVLKDMLVTPIPLPTLQYLDPYDLTYLFIETLEKVARRLIQSPGMEDNGCHGIMTTIVDECLKHNSFTSEQKARVSSFKQHFTKEQKAKVASINGNIGNLGTNINSHYTAGRYGYGHGGSGHSINSNSSAGSGHRHRAPPFLYGHHQNQYPYPLNHNYNSNNHHHYPHHQQQTRQLHQNNFVSTGCSLSSTTSKSSFNSSSLAYQALFPLHSSSSSPSSSPSPSSSVTTAQSSSSSSSSSSLSSSSSSSYHGYNQQLNFQQNYQNFGGTSYNNTCSHDTSGSAISSNPLLRQKLSQAAAVAAAAASYHFREYSLLHPAQTFELPCLRVSEGGQI